MNKYKSLAAWQHAHRLCIETLRITDGGYHPRARPVFEQLRRAAVSVEANIVEGYALGTTRNFRRHLRIALGSAAETECLLNSAAELGYLPTEASLTLQTLVGKTLRTLYGLLRSATLRTRNLS